MSTSEGRVRTRALPSLLGWGFWLKLAAVAIFDALLVFAIPGLITNQSWVLLSLSLLAGLLVNWAYLSPRANASKWLTPGLILMALFVVYPVVYTAYVSFTNWQTGNFLTKDQAITQLERAVIAADTSTTLKLTVFQNPAGEIAFYLQAPDGSVYFGVPRDAADPPVADGLLDPQALGVTDADGDGVPETIGDFTALTNLQVTGLAGRGLLESSVLDIPGGVAQVQTTKQARLVKSGKRYTFDPATDTLYDALTDQTCSVETGHFVCPDGTSIDPGWRVVIGAKNYTDILANANIRRPFLRVFIWNIIFGVGSVVLTFGLGLLLANALVHDRLRGRALYRSIYIIPYSIPAFLSVLVWRGLMNDTYGQVNRALNSVGVASIPWLQDPTWAKVAVLAVNLWLGFPYMFLICSGALTSIPTELKEAARVDGASSWKVFRTITLPLLLVSTAPLLIGSFAYNFNNFVLIYLLTNGGPPLTGYAVPVGGTDILISFTFDLAVTSGRGNQYALASAIVVLIFFIVATLSAVSFRFTKRLEDVYGG